MADFQKMAEKDLQKLMKMRRTELLIQHKKHTETTQFGLSVLNSVSKQAQTVCYFEFRSRHTSIQF